MGAFDDLIGKAQHLAADHPDQVESLSDQAIDHAGDAADKVSHGKHVRQIDDLQEKADDAVGN